MQYGKTALTYGVRRGATEGTMHLLLENKADINHATKVVGVERVCLEKRE